MENLVIITGLSGSGKSLAANCLEDLGFICVDNLPISLIQPFCDLARRGAGPTRRSALVVDIREGAAIRKLPDTLQALRGTDIPLQVLFFESSDEVLKKLAELDFDSVYFGHGEPVEANASSLVAELAATL